METTRTNPCNSQIRLSYLFLLLALGISLLTGCDREELEAPAPVTHTDVSNVVFRSFEEVTIYRMELRLFTANVEDAGTDDGVYVLMNDRDQRFFLNKSTDDFVRAHSDYYDVLSRQIKKVGDIQFLKIGLRGDDGLALKRVEFYLNGNPYPVYVKEFPGQGRWLDNSQSFTIPTSDLRAFPGWRFTPQHSKINVAPASISQDMMKSLVENAIGNQLNYLEGFDWGSKVRGLPNTLFGPAVEITYVDEKTLHVDLDLQRDLAGPNPEVDVDFDLAFSCQGGIIKTELKNLKVETNWIGEVQKWIREKGTILIGMAIGTEAGSPETGTALGGLLARALAFDFKPDLQHPTISSSCQLIRVSPDGSLALRNASSNGGVFVGTR